MIQALKCWFGGVLLLVATVRAFWLGDPGSLIPLVIFILAIALVSTLATLVIESLTARTVPAAGHVGMIALIGAVVVGLFSLNPGWAVLGFVVCLAAAGLGALLTIGAPTWRRYLIALAGAVVIALLTPFFTY